MRIFMLIISWLLTAPFQAKPLLLSAKELSNSPPNIIRTCCSFGYDLSVARIPFVRRTDIISIQDLGTHNYQGSKTEGNGIIYTKRGGFIDLGHLRDFADWTAYLYSFLVAQKAEEGDILLKLNAEGGGKKLIINNLSQHEAIDLYELAGSIAYDISIWHEIATWFGASYIPLIPERYSSFSPEDLYSNLLGVKIGIAAVKSDLDFNEAMTKLLAETLNELEAVSTVEETMEAMEQVEDLWWTRKKALPNGKVLMKRYLDLEESLIPWLSPNEATILTPFELQKPDADLRALYELQIKVNNKNILKSIGLSPNDKLVNQHHFDTLLQYIFRTEEF